MLLKKFCVQWIAYSKANLLNVPQVYLSINVALRTPLKWSGIAKKIWYYNPVGVFFFWIKDLKGINSLPVSRFWVCDARSLWATEMNSYREQEEAGADKGELEEQDREQQTFYSPQNFT